MEFNIGQKVRIKPYEQLPNEFRNNGISKLAGKDCIIVDKLYSEKKGCTIYKVRLDGKLFPSVVEFTEECLDLIRFDSEYSYEFEFLENLVVARLYRVEASGKKTEIEKGHGHIFHDGVEGIAQASSYALKKIYQKINGGNL